jgi:hypothetical protein
MSDLNNWDLASEVCLGFRSSLPLYVTYCIGKSDACRGKKSKQISDSSQVNNSTDSTCVARRYACWSKSAWNETDQPIPRFKCVKMKSLEKFETNFNDLRAVCDILMILLHLPEFEDNLLLGSRSKSGWRPGKLRFLKKFGRRNFFVGVPWQVEWFCSWTRFARVGSSEE